MKNKKHPDANLRDKLLSIGFKEIPTFNILNSLTYDLGRNRQLSFGSIGTCNEMLFICEIDHDDKRKITDLICLKNYDYDGFTSFETVQSIISLLEHSI